MDKFMKQQEHITIKAPYNRIHKLIFGEDPDENAGEKYSLMGEESAQVTGKFNPIQPIESPVGQQLNSDPSQIQQFQLPRTASIVEPMANPSIDVGPVPETSFDKLKTLLSNAPTRDQYEPSKTRKFAGALVGGLTGAAYGPERGSKVAGDIVDQPYKEAYGDWQTRTGALGKEAEFDNLKSTLDINRKKAESDQSNMEFDNLLNLQDFYAKNDPDLAAAMASGKTRGEEAAKEPNRVKADLRKQDADKAIEDLRFNRETSLEELRQKGREKLSTSEIKSRESIANKHINSAENIARLNRELRAKMAKDNRKGQRVSPNQQGQARLMAENEVSQLVSSADELTALFNEMFDNNGNVIGYKLKPKSEITDSFWLGERKKREDASLNILKRILGNSYDPKLEDQEDDEEDDLDYIKIDGVEP